MAYIDIYLEKENGEKIDELIDSKKIITKIFKNHSLESFCCFKFIDFYGNTVFNELQMDQLKKECEIIKEQSLDEEVKDFLGNLIKLIDKCKNRVHTYIKFYGD